MKRASFIIALCGLGGLFCAHYFFQESDKEKEDSAYNKEVELAEKPKARYIARNEELIPEYDGDNPAMSYFLRDYASPSLSPTNDLILLDALLGAFRTSMNGPGSIPTDGNAEIVRALQGDNPFQEVYLPSVHPYISDNGVLLDRWKQPIFFHFNRGEHPDLRSAGPDQKLWTDDDILIKQ